MTSVEMTVMKRISSLFCVGALALLLGACAAPGPTPGEMEIRSGTIEQITSVQLASNHAPGVGAVVGGVTGLGIGSLIGGGTGRDVAMVLGTIGGAVAGNALQRRYDAPQPGQQIIVRSYNNVLVSVTQPVNPELRVGQPVFIEGRGDGARVVPRR
jgi:outer membrane lipoprotein SlyB